MLISPVDPTGHCINLANVLLNGWEDNHAVVSHYMAPSNYPIPKPMCYMVVAELFLGPPSPPTAQPKQTTERPKAVWFPT